MSQLATRIAQLAPGMALCLIIALPSYFLGSAFEVIGGPVFAILFGCIVALIAKEFLGGHSELKAGVNFTSKYVLQAAVVLLGFGLNLSQILTQGYRSLPIIIVTISTALIVSYLVCRALKMPRAISTLVGVGSSICGGSAIAATAPVIQAKDEEVAQAISVIFFFNVIAALIFPALGQMLGLTNDGFALFAGTAVNDTSSVTATAAAWDGAHLGADTLSAATIVKLTRTLAIIPITLVLSLITLRRDKRAGTSAAGAEFSLRRAFPTFVGLFIVASIITTVAPLPAALIAVLKWASKFFIICAMAAIGLNTDIVKLIKTGAKPLAMGALCWVAIAVVSLGMQHLLGIW